MGLTSTCSIAPTRPALDDVPCRRRTGRGSTGALIVSGQQSVWADGPPGLLWRTTNGGRNWAALPLLLALKA